MGSRISSLSGPQIALARVGSEGSKGRCVSVSSHMRVQSRKWGNVRVSSKFEGSGIGLALFIVAL